ncbi:glucose-6-phosphate isomerase [Rhizina undulata]
MATEALKAHPYGDRNLNSFTSCRILMAHTSLRLYANATRAESTLFLVASCYQHDNFHQFLAGAHAMDFHFMQTPMEHNILVLGGSINFCTSLPVYLHQIFMESNGKSITRTGERNLEGNSITLVFMDTTGAVVFGEPATDSQHSMLASKFFAQSEALMIGKTPAEMTPTALGAIINYYEHVTFTEGAIWKTNSFDKCEKIVAELEADITVQSHGSSTNGLINAFRQL